MKVFIATPAPRSSTGGNRVTADRWAHLLRALGHQVSVAQDYHGEPSDVLIALHARKSATAIEAFRSLHADRPVILSFTGTDIYGGLSTDRVAQRSIGLATRFVVLQARALDELPEDLKGRTTIIYQSAVAPDPVPAKRGDIFQVCVLAHLRDVKDPLRAAYAARLLPANSRARIVHLGAALTTEMETEAIAEMHKNDRYHWMGMLPRQEALETLARSRLLVLSSKHEGGANVLSEAIAASVPILASRIPGSTGILGDDHPGLFPVGDTESLARLLDRAESDRGFYTKLAARSKSLAPLVHPDRERECWSALLSSLP